MKVCAASPRPFHTNVRATGSMPCPLYVCLRASSFLAGPSLLTAPALPMASLLWQAFAPCLLEGRA